LITYDTQPISLQKTAYINQQGLGGAMWWELSGDAPEETGRNLVRTVKEAIGGLEWRENELRYPGSSKLQPESLYLLPYPRLIQQNTTT
jgi:chitinase